jgi:hypothetical protein
MKPEDEQPSQEELREAAALAAALETDPAGGGAPTDALETAALLRHARAPLAVSPAHEPVAAAHVAPALDARRMPRPRRSRMWIAISLVAPAAAAGWLFLAHSPMRGHRHIQPTVYVGPPAPSSDLLAAQAAATRGDGKPGAALARLDLEMRAYRRQYHEGLRRVHGGTR